MTRTTGLHITSTTQGTLVLWVVLCAELKPQVTIWEAEHMQLHPIRICAFGCTYYLLLSMSRVH